MVDCGSIEQRTGGTLILNPSPVREKEGETSNVQRPTSNVQRPTSNVQRPTSNVERWEVRAVAAAEEGSADKILAAR
jgi:hypothetical protein